MRNAILYHYTNQLALLSILKSGKLRATHARFMNDRSELDIGLDVISTILSSTDLPGAYQAAKTLETTSAYFVTSFSAAGDAITMWGNYKGGYSIGFKTEHLISVGRRLLEVHYDRDSFVLYVKQVLSEVADTSDSLYFSMAASYKNASWKHEEEWRLIFANVEQGQHLVYYDGARTFPRPYIEWHLPSSLAEDLNNPPSFDNSCNWWVYGGANDCPIDHIIVGPSECQNERYDALSYLVGTYHLPIEVRRSPLALRNV